MRVPGLTNLSVASQADIETILDHGRLFGGIIRYVDGTNGDDTNDGRAPTSAFATIGAALSASSAGDAVNVKQGTYDEAGLDVNLAGLELWLESGVILQDSADGTVLTVSGFGAFVRGSGNVRIDPTGGATGVLISGSLVYAENLRINCDDDGALGYDITGSGAVLSYCRCNSPTTAAFKVQATTAMLRDCSTCGNGNTIGFWVTNSCAKVRMRFCHSQGHRTAGFQVDVGCTDGVIAFCTSGGQDGLTIDNGTRFHWPHFSSVSGREQHHHIYPTPDGEGTAGDPITVTTDAADETNGPATTANYWGEPKVFF
jgi:hypothetical protein